MSAVPHWELTLWLYGVNIDQNALLGKAEGRRRPEVHAYREVRWTIALEVLRRGVLSRVEASKGLARRDLADLITFNTSLDALKAR